MHHLLLPYVATFAVPVADAAAAALSTPACGSPELDRSLWPGPWWNEPPDIAAGFLQKALWYKTRTENEFIPAASNNQTVGRYWMPHRPSPACSPYEGNVGSILPFTLQARKLDMIFQEMGLVRKRRPCNQQELSFIDILPDASVEQKNRVAMYAIGIWAAIIGTLVVWSVISLLLVPRKRENDNLDGKLLLADEDAAWKSGFFTWVSVGWADDVVARYGKCLYAVIDDRDFHRQRADENWEPHAAFSRLWDAEVKAKGVKEASLVKVMYRAMGWKPCLAILAAVAVDIVIGNIGMVLVTDFVMTQLERRDQLHAEFPDRPYSLLEPTLAVMLLVFFAPMVTRIANVATSLLDAHYTNFIGAGVAASVFRKAMVLPAGNCPEEDPEKQFESGWFYGTENMKPHVVQLLNVDILETFSGIFRYLAAALIAPFVSLILFAMLIAKVHFAAFIGVLYQIPVTIATTLVTMWIIQCYIRQQGYQDNRLKTLTEAITHIRTIKSLAWEMIAFERLHRFRKLELLMIQMMTVLAGVQAAIMHTMPWGTTLLCFAVAFALDGDVKAHQLVVVQRILGSLLAMVGISIDSIQRVLRYPNNFRRLHLFLERAERPNGICKLPPALQNSGTEAPMVRVRGSFTYAEGIPPVLQDLDITVSRGELVGIVGGVASGKSSLLLTIIGELFPVGNATLEAPDTSTGRVAFCSQVPWIFEGTLKENVLLMEAAAPDLNRYHKSLYAASLTQDFEMLPGGDQVTIGSYGIRLSGGQRARVALARAAYSKDAELLVFDDPFASVDAPTGQHLFEELINGPVTQGKTRIVVTQPHPGRLKKFDRLVVLDGGRVVAQGTPAKVMESAPYQSLLSSSSTAAETATWVESLPFTPRLTKTDAKGSEEVTALVLQRKANDQAIQLREDENHDHITWQSISWWVRAAGFFNLTAFFAMILLVRYMELRESLAMAQWVDAKVFGPVDDWYYMRMILAVVLLTSVATAISWYTSSRVQYWSARQLHSAVLFSMMRASIDRFFDKQPVGRLLNRLSFDMRQVDDGIVGSASSILFFIVSVVMTQAFIQNIMPVYVRLLAFPLYAAGFFFLFLYRGLALPLVFHAKYSLSSVQDLQASVLNSCISIRANKMLLEFQAKHSNAARSFTRANTLGNIAQAWLSSRIFLTFSVLAGLFALAGVCTEVPLGTLNLIIMLSFSLITDFESSSMQFTGFLNILNALQRLTRYFEITHEAVSELSEDPKVRVRQQLTNDEMALLEVRRRGKFSASELAGAAEDGVLLVCFRGTSEPLLQATKDGFALELMPGRTMSELAPRCRGLQSLSGPYRLVALNNITRSAERMAEMLCNPPTHVWFDLWDSKFADGMSVKIEDLTAGYGTDESPSVLLGINVDIKPRAKVGFAGQTGCGKSTTLLCLQRVLEPRRGCITIGGMNTKDMGLTCLRTICGLVPQDPTVFEGTIRYNMDPFDEFPDACIWAALAAVKLTPFIRLLKDGLNAEITKDGSNLSMGQRQLLSLARMVIRQPPVLLLDECTSALDPSTQESVQKTLLERFPLSTVIAVAHRVETILEFDQIVVFDKGIIKESGSVEEVLKIKDGIFALMVQKSQRH